MCPLGSEFSKHKDKILAKVVPFSEFCQGNGNLLMIRAVL